MDDESSNNRPDHDLLIEVIARLKILEKNQENHIRHHWAVTILALSAGLVGTINLCVGLILILIKS